MKLEITTEILITYTLLVIMSTLYLSFLIDLYYIFYYNQPSPFISVAYNKLKLEIRQPIKKRKNN